MKSGDRVRIRRLETISRKLWGVDGTIKGMEHQRCEGKSWMQFDTPVEIASHFEPMRGVWVDAEQIEEI